MSDTLTQTEQQTQTTETQPQDNSAAIANAIWGEPAAVVQPKVEEQAAATTTQAEGVTTTAVKEEETEYLSVDDWVKRQFEYDNLDTFKNEWAELRTLKEQQQTAAAVEEPKWANEESKQAYELLREGKRDDVRRILNQQAELERLEKFDITDAAQAAEIIKANLQFKYKDLDPKQIDRLYSRQYELPAKPQQDLQTDEEYAQEIAQWQRQVQDKEMDIMIDAKIAQPELANYKKQIVFPDIPKANNAGQQLGPTQEDLAAQKAYRDDFVQKLGTEYRNFKGYNTIAKDGEVELPISYSLNDDEKLAFNATVQKAVDNIQGFLDNDLGWWDAKNNSFNINKMQEDLYLLLNKDKVISKFAGEAAAQRFQHHLKITNNIKLEGVNSQTNIPTGQVLDEKARNQKVAESVWSF
jgi:hypothetical protein